MTKGDAEGRAMRRLVLGGGVAMGVLLVGSIAVILWATRPSRAPSGGAAPEPAAPATEDTAAIPPAPLAPPAVPRQTAYVAPRRARAALAATPASTLPTAPRVVRTIVRKRLLAGGVQARLARCVGAVGEADDVLARGEPPLLWLDLEAHGRRVRIVDAYVQRWGGASHAAVDCARDVLRAQTFPAPAAQDGRTRMPFLLNPRSEAMSSR